MLSSAPVRAGDLSVTVQGVRNGAGEVRFALYDKAEEFPRGKRYEGFEVPAARGAVTGIFKNVPAGTYAVAVHHDENSNNQMDLVFGLLPKEGYGFSNDAKVIIAPPTFKAASFEVSEGGAAIRLTMVY